MRILIASLAIAVSAVAVIAVLVLHPWRPSLPQPMARSVTGAAYTQAYVKHLEALRITDPIAAKADPYAYYSDKARALAPPRSGAVCAVKYEDAAHTRYSIHNYGSGHAALADGAHVTHTGRCGTCSTLQDLAVYLRYPDLTAPVRRCGMLTWVKPLAMKCLAELGFSQACAETWYADAQHTGQVCWKICMEAWIAGTPSNGSNGHLNACLACDETQSGPVFKHEAGRTRRNSGIVSSIDRGHGEVSPVVHKY